ncbi:glycosyl transferase [Actinoplanes cyaneus]|uniref:Glycosyl transferase n=2 Tax=Actinoplanes cyaneus TaxID=52696 RepID=A0A919IIS2_9ACTN|nr:glycosyl transferase [Actinoplanes cyaneus]
MTITGFDATGQTAGENVLPSRQVTAAEDLDAELRALEGGIDTAAPLAPAPVGEKVDEQVTVPARRRPLWQVVTWRDVLAIASFLGVALFVTAPLWLNLDHELRDDPQDQAFFEWMLAHGARVLTDGVYPFFSDRMNYPDGVNMMANTSVLAVSLPLTPITLAFGPHVAFNVFLTGALSLTGVSWYLVLSRRVVASRLAAWVGALFAAFAPSMIAHATGHPNIVSQFLVPLIIWRTLELRVPGRAVRNGLLLGGLLVWQAFINLEILLMTAIGVGVFCLVMGLVRHRRHRGEVLAFLRGLTIAAAVTIAALAYPLSVQFFGPQSYQGLSVYVRSFGSDLGSFTAYSTHSVAGNPLVPLTLAQNPSEQNAFFGWGLVVLFFGLMLWLRRSAAVLTLGFLALLFGAMSLGPRIYLDGKDTGVPGIWAFLHHLPVLNSAVPTRWAMAIAPIVGIVLALGCQRAADQVRTQPHTRGPIRVAMITAVAMALVPLVPVQLTTVKMDPVPEFVTSGAWRQYVDDNHTVVTLPLPDNFYSDPLRWSAYTKQDMRIAGGYALLPNQDPQDPADRTAAFAPPWRPTSGLMASIRRGNPTPDVTDARREMTLADLRYWKAGVVVLTPQTRDIEMLRTMSDLLGFRPTWTGGVWMWDVRNLVDNPDAVVSTDGDS